MRNGERDTRERAKRQEEFYRSNPVQRCVVCGRQFIRRKDNVCSLDCLKKQETQKSAATF
jgi:predicted nucleic acid-binding Zn ribbon protein